MTDIVPAGDIEGIVGAPRDAHHHIGRLVGDTVFIMHSKKCTVTTRDLRDCRFSRALDTGLITDPADADDADFIAGHACRLYVIDGRLRVAERWITEPEHVRALTTATHRIRDGRAVCDGDSTARCHWWPDPADCEHDVFPCGHDYVDHGECWVVPWIDSGALDDSAVGRAADRYDPDLPGGFPDGPITWTWEGDYVTWDYDTERDDLISIADATVAAILIGTAPDHNEQEQR